MPISPAKTRSCSRRSSGRRRVLGQRVRRQPAARDAERAQRLAGERLVRPARISARRSGVSGRVPSPTSFVRAARQQHVGRALGEARCRDPAARCRGARCSSACARTRTAPRRRAAAARRAPRRSRPALRAATSSAPSVGSPCTVQRPSRSLHDRVVGAIGDRERALELDPQRRRRSAPPPSRAHRARPARSPSPRTSTRPLAVTTTRTVISFFVSVPVLSEAMTVAEPSVSTAARCRTIALRRAMRCTPIDSTAVTTAGRPSGTAATASATPRISTSKSAGGAAHVLDERRSSRSSRRRWR